MRVSREAWRQINQEREPNETLDEVLLRIFDDRRKLRAMIAPKQGEGF